MAEIWTRGDGAGRDRGPGGGKGRSCAHPTPLWTFICVCLGTCLLPLGPLPCRAQVPLHQVDDMLSAMVQPHWTPERIVAVRRRILATTAGACTCALSATSAASSPPPPKKAATSTPTKSHTTTKSPATTKTIKLSNVAATSNSAAPGSSKTATTAPSATNSAKASATTNAGLTGCFLCQAFSQKGGSSYYKSKSCTSAYCATTGKKKYPKTKGIR